MFNIKIIQHLKISGQVQSNSSNVIGLSVLSSDRDANGTRSVLTAKIAIFHTCFVYNLSRKQRYILLCKNNMELSYMKNLTSYFISS